jgi:hypothetical protein
MPPTIKSRVTDRTVFYRLAADRTVTEGKHGERQTYVPPEPVPQQVNHEFEMLMMNAQQPIASSYNPPARPEQPINVDYVMEPQRPVDSSYEQERRRILNQKRMNINHIWGKDVEETKWALRQVLITVPKEEKGTQTKKCCTLL